MRLPAVWQVWQPAAPPFEVSVHKKQAVPMRVDIELHWLHPVAVQLTQFNPQAAQVDPDKKYPARHDWHEAPDVHVSHPTGHAEQYE